MQSAAFSAMMLPNESAIYIFTMSSSCWRRCWNSSNSTPAVAVKKAKASEPRNWRVMVLPIERTVSFTVNVAFSVSSSPSAMKKKKRGRRRGVVRSSKVFISSITIPSGIESLYPIAS